MTDPIVALHQVAADVADDLRIIMAAKAYAASVAAATPPTRAARPPQKINESPQVVFTRALANIDTLVTMVRTNPTILGNASTSTIQKLEAQYGNTLGRFIAAVGGLPVANLARSDSLTRLLASDPSARAELAHIDPNEGELLEVLFEIFVAAPRTSDRKSGATRPSGSVGDEAPAHRDTNHMAELIAERAQYVIPSIIPPAAMADDVTEGSDADRPPERVHRIDPIDKSKRQK